MTTRLGSTVLAVVTGAAIFLVALVVPKLLFSGAPATLGGTQAIEGVLALAAIVVLGRGRFAEYGFRAPRLGAPDSIGRGKLALFCFAALAVGAVTSAAMLAGGGKGNPVVKQLSLPQMIMFVWFFSSTVEEILTRGFVQGHIERFWGSRGRGPVLVSASFFASMHLSLIRADVDGVTLGTILPFTFVVGLLAGQVRLWTGSVYPAILVHMAANVGGVIGGMAYTIISVINGGSIPGR